jgi:hypothetical protein
MRAPIAMLLALGCGGSPSPSSPPPSPSPPAIVREVVFTGMCDASGAVPLSATRFVVADDEDNVLRVYDVDRGGAPLAQHDMSAALHVPVSDQPPRVAECDLEGATRLGDRAYWIASHARSTGGAAEPARMRFFATTLPSPGDTMQVVGTVYEHLVDDAVSDPRLARLGLDAARQLPPKAPGGLNVEGLTAAPDGTLLIGFRSPVPGGRALIVPLLDARGLIEGTAGRARFGAPLEVDLGGQGVRALSTWRGLTLIAAGNPGDGGRSRLFTWRGDGAPSEVALDLAIYNPEAFFTPDERDAIMILSDDGSQVVDGKPCKRLADPARKRFRGVWIALPH